MKNRAVYLGIIFTLFVVGCNSEELIHNLDERSANKILLTLNKHQIFASKFKAGKSWTLELAKKDKDFALELIHSARLDEIRGPQQVAKSTLFMSPEERKQALIRDIETRLEDTIISIPGIVDAKVHLSNERASIFVLAESTAEDLKEELQRLAKGALNQKEIEIIFHKQEGLHQIMHDAPSEISPPLHLKKYGSEFFLSIFLPILIIIPVVVIIFYLFFKNSKKLKPKLEII